MRPRLPRGGTRGRRSSSPGFLLVEALASMVVSAVILLGLVSSVALLTRGSERATRLSSEIEATTRALDTIARDLRGAAQIRWAGGGFVFSGGPSELVFARRYADTGEMRLIALSAGGAPANRVSRAQGLLAPGAQGTGDISNLDAAPIYDGALSMRFSYFAPLPDGSEALLDSWSTAQEMPRAVRIAMIEPSTGEIASSIRVPLMIDAEPGCAAPSTALCSYVANGVADALGAEDAPRELVDPNDPAGWMRYAR